MYKRALEEQYKLKMKASRCAVLRLIGFYVQKAVFVGGSDGVVHASASTA